MGQAYDVIIIGGGFIGAATAYHLARRGVSVLLLEGRSLGGVSSAVCGGRAQVAEGYPGLHMDLVLRGLARLEHLEEELGASFEWRRMGNVMLIRREEHWRHWVEQVAYLKARGVPACMLDLAELRALEPLLCTDGLLGASWSLEGHLNPFKYGWAWLRAARRHGALLRQGETVIAIEHQGYRVIAVETKEDRYAAGTVVVAAGAWSGRVLALAGAKLPVRFTNAEAMITERLSPTLRHHVGMADFYETIHNQPRAVSMSVLQTMDGGLYIAESVEMAEEVRLWCSAWGPAGMADGFCRLFPSLAQTRILRAWAGPSPFLPDGEPGIGFMPGWENLFVATCFHLCITTTPALTEMIASMILGEAVCPSLESFSPARFGNL